MGDKMVSLLWMVVGVLFLLTVATSKPVSVNTAADESDSVEANSSEEAAIEEVEEVEGPEGPELPETTATESAVVVTEPPSVVSLSDPPPTVALPVSADSTFPPETIDPQTSTDGLQMLPDDPTLPSMGGVDLSQDMPETDPAHDPLAPNVEVGVAADLPQQQTNEVQQEVVPAVTPYPPHIEEKSMHVSVVNAVPVHVSDPSVPVCFTFHTQLQHVAPQSTAPRGDSY